MAGPSARAGTGEQAAARARDRKADDALGEALVLFVDAARAYAADGNEKEARRCAREALALWPDFEATKRLDMTPARAAQAPQVGARPLRRRPGARGQSAPAPAPRAESAASLLPSMFIELHADALRLAGEEKAARERLAEAQAAVEAEFARRRSEQAWAEAFSAALAVVRMAEARGGDDEIAAARRSFIEAAREAGREALTPEYFSRGKDALPVAALEAASEQARLLKDAKLTAELEAERAQVERRTREVLADLGDPRTAAEAILSWEDSWPALSKNARLRRALLEAPDRAADLSGPLADLASMAATHPTRLEVAEFAERHAALVAHARARSR